MVPYRSILFVPGHKPAWIDKALAAGADCLVLDLEDSVPADLKAGARRPWPSRSPPSARRTRAVGVFVRVNPLDTRMTGADLEAVVVPGLTGVFAPEDQHGHRRPPLRRAARPLRGAQRGRRAGVHRAGRDDRGDPERPGDRALLAAGGRDDRPHRRARRHRPRGGLPVDAGGGGDPLPAQPDPARLPGGRHPPADRALGAAGGPRRAQGLRREGAPARLPRDDRDPPVARGHGQRGVHRLGGGHRVPRGARRRLRDRPPRRDTARSATAACTSTRRTPTPPVEWLQHARAIPGGAACDRPAPADALGIDAPEGGH